MKSLKLFKTLHNPALKGLASAVQLRPWPPYLQSVKPTLQSSRAAIVGWKIRVAVPVSRFIFLSRRGGSPERLSAERRLSRNLRSSLLSREIHNDVHRRVNAKGFRGGSRRTINPTRRRAYCSIVPARSLKRSMTFARSSFGERQDPQVNCRKSGLSAG